MFSFWITYFIGFGLFAFLVGKALDKENAPIWKDCAIIFFTALLWPTVIIGTVIIGIVSLFQHEDQK